MYSRLLPALVLASALPSSAGTLTVFFIDPGYQEYSGDAMLVIAPDGSSYVIDGGDHGSSPYWDCGQSRILPLLDSLGIYSLDGIVATHAHSDHVGGLSSVLASTPADVVWDSAWPYTPTPAYTEFLQQVEQSGAAYVPVRMGDTLDWGPGLSVEALHPAEPLDPGNLNNSSIVLRVTMGSVSFLFCGDIETEGGEDEILAALGAGLVSSVSADVMKVPHHGSSTSSCAAWLDAVDPVWAAIEVGAGNPYGHPHGEVLARLYARDIEVFRTDQLGTFFIATDGEELYFNSLPPSEGQPVEELTAYPSPARSSITFEWPAGFQAASLDVYNLLGENVLSIDSPANPTNWDFSLDGGSLASPGLYCVTVELVGGTRWTERFAISR